jgi:hypothetical protein
MLPLIHAVFDNLFPGVLLFLCVFFLLAVMHSDLPRRKQNRDLLAASRRAKTIYQRRRFSPIPFR